MIHKLFVALFVLLSYTNLRADEGMWLYTMLDRLHLEQKGCKLTAEQIYSINHNSLKDAILGLGSIDRPTSFFCTAELVGSRGLVFTNHHCGYEYIAQHSTVLHNYLHDGFWAKSDAEELPNKGFTAARLVYMQDMTDSITSHLNDTMSVRRRQAIIDSLSETIEKRATDSTNYAADVEDLYAGNQFILFVYEVYKDIRLVGTPPESIGKFGGDTDNWMWPRHTGDFSVFRIYVDSTGKSAEYDSRNVPLQTTQNLKISLAGYDAGSFAMIMGYPGSTERYVPAIAIEHKLKVLNPLRIDIRTRKMNIYKQYMDADSAIYLKYATKYAQTSNYWKNFIGENESIQQLDVIKQKKEVEANLQNWINQDSVRKTKYGKIINSINTLHERRLPLAKLSTNILESFFLTSHYCELGYDLTTLAKALADGKDSTIAEEADDLQETLQTQFEQFHAPLEIDILAEMLSSFTKQHPDLLPDVQKRVSQKFAGNYHKYSEYLANKSILSSEQKMKSFLKNPTLKVIEKDEAYQLMFSILTSLRNARKQNQLLQDSILILERQYVAALLEKNTNRPLYPDACGTPRLTYGTVAAYKPRDAVYYNYYTTIQGIMQKENPHNPQEFSVPQELKNVYKKKDFGRYATSDSLRVCFLTDNDITGGNSGSPVLNANGALIGIAFDGNWESLSGDIIFAKATQRTINVDIRYVLFIIDKLAGCTRLLDELSIVQ